MDRFALTHNAPGAAPKPLVVVIYTKNKEVDATTFMELAALSKSKKFRVLDSVLDAQPGSGATLQEKAQQSGADLMVEVAPLNVLPLDQHGDGLRHFSVKVVEVKTAVLLAGGNPPWNEVMSFIESAADKLQR